ncbi:MAG: MazG nucleotide pyrophosphohydrolase domain-containing protein [Candidatus Pacearchaeota archaeon]
MDNKNNLAIKQMQTEAYSIIEKWNKKNNRIHDKKTIFPHLVEEVGELAREYNHFIDNWRHDGDKEKLSEELVDVLIQIFDFATDFDIDLESTFKKKIQKLKERFGLE